MNPHFFHVATELCSVIKGHNFLYDSRPLSNYEYIDNDLKKNKMKFKNKKHTENQYAN